MTSTCQIETRDELGRWLPGRSPKTVCRARVALPPETPRACAWCARDDLTIEDFSPHAASLDGRRPECRHCRAARRRELRRGALRVGPWGIVR